MNIEQMINELHCYVSPTPMDFLFHEKGVTIWIQKGRNFKIKDSTKIIYKMLSLKAEGDGLIAGRSILGDSKKNNNIE